MYHKWLRNILRPRMLTELCGPGGSAIIQRWCQFASWAWIPTTKFLLTAEWIIYWTVYVCYQACRQKSDQHRFWQQPSRICMSTQIQGILCTLVLLVLFFVLLYYSTQYQYQDHGRVRGNKGTPKLGSGSDYAAVSILRWHPELTDLCGSRDECYYIFTGKKLTFWDVIEVSKESDSRHRKTTGVR